MNKSTLYFTVEIPGILGKIVPEIKVTIPKSVLFAIITSAAKKAVRQELKRHDAQAAPIPTAAPDNTSGYPDS